MNITFLLFLAGLIISCAKKTELTPHEKLLLATEELVTESDKASHLLNQAREKFWPDHPNLQAMLDINKETGACIKTTILSDEFHAHKANLHRVEPDSSIINTMTQAYKAETDCYKAHNKAMKALLD